MSRMLATVAAPIGAAWVRHRRNAYQRDAMLFGACMPAVADRLRPYFGAAMIERTWVARVATIANPIPAVLLRSSMTRGMLDLATVRGMAMIDTIVLAEANVRSGDREDSLLFHELVHVAQFGLLGATGFVRAYINGWLTAGRSYLDNPLEAMAFDLQDRSDGGQGVFDAGAEVTQRLRDMTLM